MDNSLNNQITSFVKNIISYNPPECQDSISNKESEVYRYGHHIGIQTLKEFIDLLEGDDQNQISREQIKDYLDK